MQPSCLSVDMTQKFQIQFSPPPHKMPFIILYTEEPKPTQGDITSTGVFDHFVVAFGHFPFQLSICPVSTSAQETILDHLKQIIIFFFLWHPHLGREQQLALHEDVVRFYGKEVYVSFGQDFTLGCIIKRIGTWSYFLAERVHEGKEIPDLCPESISRICFYLVPHLLFWSAPLPCLDGHWFPYYC